VPIKSKLPHVFSCIILTLALRPFAARSQTVTLTQTAIQSTAYSATLDAGSAPSLSGYSTMQSFSTADQNPSSLGLPDTLNLFCVELGQDSSTSPLSYAIDSIAQADMNRTPGSIDADAGIPTGGIGADAGMKLEKLYGFVFPAYTNSSPLNVDLSAAGISGSAAYNSAVFQLAVWQVAETDSFGSIGTTGPGFFASSSTPTLRSDANQLLASVASDPSVTPLNLDALTSGTNQDYILPDPSGSFTSIPEPSSFAAVIGTLSIAAASLSRRRKSSG
jgi:hypothetical protein